MKALQVDTRGGGTWQLLKLGKTGRHNESSASGQAPGGGTWQTGAKVSAQARPSQWDSIHLVIV